MHLHIDALPRPKLSEQDIRVDRPDGTMRRGEELLLSAGRVKLQRGSIDMCVMVEFRGVRLILRRFLVPRAFDVQLQHQGVVVGRVAGVGILLGSPLERLQPIEALDAALQWHQAEPVGEHFVLDDGGVVPDVDGLDGDGGDFGDEDAAEGVGDGGVDADEGEAAVELFVFVELDL